MKLAEGVRSACLRAALDAYEDAGLRGLCAEGRWECALDAIRSLAPTPLLGLDETEWEGGPRAEDTSRDLRADEPRLRDPTKVTPCLAWPVIVGPSFAAAGRMGRRHGPPR